MYLKQKCINSQKVETQLVIKSENRYKRDLAKANCWKQVFQNDAGTTCRKILTTQLGRTGVSSIGQFVQTNLVQFWRRRVNTQFNPRPELGPGLQVRNVQKRPGPLWRKLQSWGFDDCLGAEIKASGGARQALILTPAILAVIGLSETRPVGR